MRRVQLLVLLGLIAFPAASQATVAPRPNTLLEDHLHDTPDATDWHVQIQTAKKGSRLTSVVLYAEQCDDSGLAFDVPVAPDGSFAVDRRLADGKGRWSVHATFTDSEHAVGTWSMTRGACATGPRQFLAHDGPGHYFIGNPASYPPAAIRGTSRSARRLRTLKRATLANAPRWDTPAKAAALGYVMQDPLECPGFDHARKNGSRMWGKVLDPAAPQSLVFWCDPAGRLTLAGVMYRASGSSHPPTFDDLVQWHEHGGHGTWMMHVWLVPDVVSSLATCAPFPAFESLHMFGYAPYHPDLPIDEACPDTDTSGF